MYTQYTHRRGTYTGAHAYAYMPACAENRCMPADRNFEEILEKKKKTYMT